MQLKAHCNVPIGVFINVLPWRGNFTGESETFCSRLRSPARRYAHWLRFTLSAAARPGETGRSASSSQPAAVAGYIHGQLEPAPDTQFIEGAAQVILDDLLRCARQLADFTIGEPLPDQRGHLISLGVKRSRGVMASPRPFRMRL